MSLRELRNRVKRLEMAESKRKAAPAPVRFEPDEAYITQFVEACIEAGLVEFDGERWHIGQVCNDGNEYGWLEPIVDALNKTIEAERLAEAAS